MLVFLTIMTMDLLVSNVAINVVIALIMLIIVRRVLIRVEQIPQVVLVQMVFLIN